MRLITYYSSVSNVKSRRRRQLTPNNYKSLLMQYLIVFLCTYAFFMMLSHFKMKLIQIKATLYQIYPLKGVVNELNMPKRRLKAANLSFVVYFYFHFNCHQPIDLHISLEMMQNCTFQFDFNSYAHNNHKAHNRILAFIYKLQEWTMLQFSIIIIIIVIGEGIDWFDTDWFFCVTY